MKELFKNIKERFEGISDPNDEKMPLKKRNYALLLIGFALILLGFVLMVETGSTDPNVFKEEVYGFRQITLAPMIVLAGFIFEIYAIMAKSNESVKEDKE